MPSAPDFEAAGVIPVHPSGAVLLHLRDDRPDVGSPNRWGMLGGMIEPGESPEEAAFRELEEEAGRRPAMLYPFATDDHPSLRRPGETVRSHVFGAALDWALDDLILGEGQRLDWFLPDEVPALPLVLPLAYLITGFLTSDLYARLAGHRRAPCPVLSDPLPSDLPAALGLRPGYLLAVEGVSAGLVRRLADVLPDGARITASPGAAEHPNVVLSSLATENSDAALRRWRGRLAPGGLLWLLTPAAAAQRHTLPGGLTATCVRAPW